MRKTLVERKWNTFWSSGKIDDYLAYRSQEFCEMMYMDGFIDGRINCFDRHGAYGHAGQ